MEAVNPVGTYFADATVTIRLRPLGGPPPPKGRRVLAKICTTPAQGKHKPVCARRTLIGKFPALRVYAKATVARGNVVYAVGHAGASYRWITLYRRRPIGPGTYTLIVRGKRQVSFVPVTIPKR